MFSDPADYLWLIPALPLAAAVLITFLGPWLLRRHSHWPCVLAAACSCVLSFLVLFAVGRGYGESTLYYTWFQAGNVDVGFTLRADGLTAIMLVTVTFVGTLIAIYAVGYMHHDPGYPRFFAEVSLFLFSMTGLVLADNYILLYAFWEGVGVCSYLLIGFWFTRPSAAAAARKAFLVTRIGDVGFFIGILVLWHAAGGKLDYDSVFQWAAGDPDHGVLVAACLLLFCGAVGKSGQFPLHVWLPDAMEGPTPVSALIHAATMVTAGVYLVARSSPLFVGAPEAQAVVAGIGGFTALMAALMALTQTDLKRVLAYSTISQLGYMFLALGCGVRDHDLIIMGVVAAIFHLMTHAFFKALLFMAAGSVMHAMGNVIDMRRFGGLRKVLPTTHWTFLCGAAALAGIPPLSGFWSKDEILGTAQGAMEHAHEFNGLYLFVFLAGLVSAALTAFYTFRAYFLTFWGELRVPPEAFAHAHGGDHGHADAGHHGHAPAGRPTPGESEHPGDRAGHEQQAHESPPVMTVPLMILAVGAVGLGFVLGPLTHWFPDYLTANWTVRLGALYPALFEHQGHLHEHGLDWPLMLLSSVLALGGVAAAWWVYVQQPGLAAQLAGKARAAYEFSRNRFYIDELYTALLVQPLTTFAHFCRLFDQYVVDGLVDLVGYLPAFFGKVFSPLQNGLVQFYALLMMLGLTGFVLAVLLR